MKVMLLFQLLYKLILIIIPVIIVVSISILIYNQAIFIIRSRKRSKRMIEWSDLNHNMMIWSQEIKDIEIKQEYLHFCIDIVTRSEFSDLLDEPEKMGKYTMDIKEKIINKYSKHIPSLRQSVREQKINKLLN